MALTGLNARGYKNSTLLFNLARVFIARSQARDLINPPWTRHCRADVGADADPPSLGLLRRLLHRGAARLSRDRAGFACGNRRRATSDRRRWSISASTTSREEVRSHDGSTVNVITALAPPPHPRFSRFFTQIKQDLGFGIYVPDCDTTACSFSAATQAGSADPILDQPLLDFYAGYQVARGRQRAAGDGAAQRQYRFRGRRRDLDRQPRRRAARTATISIPRSISTSSRSPSAIWRAGRSWRRRRGSQTVHRIIGFQRRLAESGAFANPRSHIYYLPELYCAYFGRCYAAFLALPPAARAAIDPSTARSSSFERACSAMCRGN